MPATPTLHAALWALLLARVERDQADISEVVRAALVAHLEPQKAAKE